ncbi:MULTISPECIES: hypothetical protein [unclassified Mesorhizobium]|uniref:hypothetical protein n=1 Tax=unclassified Mesorhizobium TaxID=325217 RepID=UPI0015E310DA|nr:MULTISPECIES: hypothetical protein [unclassified Mesorhizobium]MCA0008806.1 hypothetical protein [Mesorhizobium sp. B264B1B]MCA0021905.1 hypothetical protein [Mesorhizobium sp. B264B1A]MCA0026393.1 hypothetical protein [Mesorhizobium sp. B263B1A]MCA0056797.1 hypothetical protein [Mesorhizobium sp. B261B1A]
MRDAYPAIAAIAARGGSRIVVATAAAIAAGDRPEVSECGSGDKRNAGASIAAMTAEHRDRLRRAAADVVAAVAAVPDEDSQIVASGFN